MFDVEVRLKQTQGIRYRPHTGTSVTRLALVCIYTAIYYYSNPVHNITASTSKISGTDLASTIITLHNWVPCLNLWLNPV